MSIASSRPVPEAPPAYGRGNFRHGEWWMHAGIWNGRELGFGQPQVGHLCVKVCKVATTSWPVFIVNIYYEFSKMPHPGGYKRRPS